MKAPYRLYWNTRGRVWFAKWLAAPGTLNSRGKPIRWAMKQVPCEITHEQDAKLWMAQWWATNRIDAGAPQPVVRLTVAQLALWWVGYLKDKPGAPANASDDAERVHRIWIEPFNFAHVHIDQLQLAHCVDWIEDIQRRGRADFTVRNVVQAVRTMFSDARGKGRYRGENFFNDSYVKARLKGAEPRAGKDVIIHVPEDDARRVVEHQGDRVPLRRHVRNVLAIVSGLRSGELAALRWRDLLLDAEIPYVDVQRQYVVRRSTPEAPFFKPPKRNSKRQVPLHRRAVELLRAWKKATPFAADDDPVFGDADGRFCNDFDTGDVTKDLVAYGASPTIDGHLITPHAFRRTCLTLLTNAGAPDADIKQIAGHAKAGVTRRHYVANDLRPLARAIELLLPKKAA